MTIEDKRYEPPRYPKAGEPESSTTEEMKERGAEMYGKAKEQGSEMYDKAEHALSDAYDKTSKMASDTYRHTRQYSSENPGTTILIALGIGVGLGFLLAASSHRSSRRYAQPVIHALSDLASDIFR